MNKYNLTTKSNLLSASFTTDLNINILFGNKYDLSIGEVFRRFVSRFAKFANYERYIYKMVNTYFKICR